MIERLQSRLTRLRQGAVVISHRALPLGCCSVVAGSVADRIFDAAMQARRKDMMR